MRLNAASDCPRPFGVDSNAIAATFSSRHDNSEVRVRKQLIVTAAAVGVLASASAFAQSGYGYGYGQPYDYNHVYLGVGFGELIYSEDGLNTINPTIGYFKVGEQFNPYLAVEARIGSGVSSAESNGYSVNVNAIYSGYLKGIVPLSPQFSLYGLAGLSGANLHRNYPDYDSTDGTFSLGGGAEFKLGGGASLDAEFTRAASGTNDGYNYTADTLTVGVNWRL
jgi:Outer membrane protein beta-barrel domain